MKVYEGVVTRVNATVALEVDNTGWLQIMCAIT
jgi:hypothetical protein